MEKTDSTPGDAAKTEEELRYERDRAAWNLPPPAEPVVRAARAAETDDSSRADAGTSD